VVIGGDVRRAVADHARRDAPSESCGIVLLRDGIAERYVEGRNAAASPYRFELEVDPELWFAEDDGYELAVLHSHVGSPARPSRTDVENVGLWAGRPYLIYSLARNELRAWAIGQDGIAELPLDDPPGDFV
jgi:proteasome lid subunit RPN8/RPN11